MIKKMVILGVVGFIAVAALSGTKIASYLRSEARSMRQQAEENIPPEKELARLKNEVDELDRETKKLNFQLAKEMVEVRVLSANVDKLAAEQAERKAELKARGEAISSAERKGATEQVSYGNRTLSVAAAKTKLESDAKVYVTLENSLEGKRTELTTRTQTRDDLAKQREEIESKKAELRATLSKMEAQITRHKLQQVKSKVQTDDSKLSRIQQDMDALQKKLDIKDEELNLSQPDRNGSPTTTPAAEKSVDDILAPLNGPAKKPEPTKAAPQKTLDD